ncbi:MAG: uncharacterized protein KVP18_005168 [Porospora cf. gigantea A]|uniref:uncharacterized protein n=1 Tax=Porospora cf. gigantea A TaxID=2853593 RepID=UPI003559C1B5|nr:MAG: hypothetical protein KVP18_005168 [Porospora cf. gigantea A]
MLALGGCVRQVFVFFLMETRFFDYETLRYITETLLQSCRLPFESKFAVRLVDLVYRIMGQIGESLKSVEFQSTVKLIETMHEQLCQHYQPGVPPLAVQRKLDYIRHHLIEVDEAKYMNW